ncbi:MAG: hypothetical protein IIC51_07050, partial [Planctomycetes bacterium]|nr:hypothetical protein [Planctomycetota bacterium]
MSSHNHSPKVLVIASAFPPTGGPGVQRTLKFVKYLPQFGWSPVVWTLDRCSGLPTDETLLSDVPGGVVIHRREGGHRAMPTLMESIHRTAGKPGLFGAAARRFDRRLRTRHAGASFPDECASWAEASVSPILRVIAELGIDVLYSTFSPASNHLLAMKVREATGLPWVADFRDLWTDDYRYREPSAPLRSAHRRLEQEFLESADIVIGVSGDRQALSQRTCPRVAINSLPSPTVSIRRISTMVPMAQKWPQTAIGSCSPMWVDSTVGVRPASFSRGCRDSFEKRRRRASHS